MPKQNKQAVVIGVNEYRDQDIPRLWGAVNDATAVRRRLIDYGEFTVSDDHFLTNKRASGEAIRHAISDVLWKADPCDLVLFYFSGHGFSDGYDNGYIAPYDMLSSAPYVNGINMEDLKKLVLRSLNKQCVVVILDCCFSGILAKGDKAIPDVSNAFDAYFHDLEAAGEGKIIIASSGEDQKSREIEVILPPGQDSVTHGVFTYHLLNGLDGKAANDSGIITLDRLYSYVENQLVVNKIQKPHFYAASTSQMERIQIAIASQQFTSFINRQLDEARTNFDAGNIWTLAGAIDQVRSVLDADPDNADGLALRAAIETSLLEYHEAVMAWILEYDTELKPKFVSVFRELERLSGCLEFDKIPKLDRRGKSQLFNLCEVSRGTLELNMFVDKCRAWSNPGVAKTNH